MTTYLDYAATSFPKPEEVYKAVDQALRYIGVAPGRGEHRRGISAARLVFEAREAVAELFGIQDSSRIVFTHSATESLNLAVGGLLKPGDHVVSTTMEHNSLLRPLHRAAGAGVEVTWVAGDGTGLVDSGRVAAAIRPGTRLVALSHCSNVTGAIQPVQEIGLLARKAGALFLLDAAQSAGTLPIDVGGIGDRSSGRAGTQGALRRPGNRLPLYCRRGGTGPAAGRRGRRLFAGAGAAGCHAGTLRERHHQYPGHRRAESGAGLHQAHRHRPHPQQGAGFGRATPGGSAVDAGGYGVRAGRGGTARQRGFLYRGGGGPGGDRLPARPGL